jgi:uncharacterized protein (DUF433 family)
MIALRLPARRKQNAYATHARRRRSDRHDGKPCIKGTRITVELILRKLGAGRSFADLLEAYPQLSEDDLRAALDLDAV